MRIEIELPAKFAPAFAVDELYDDLMGCMVRRILVRALWVLVIVEVKSQ